MTTHELVRWWGEEFRLLGTSSAFDYVNRNGDVGIEFRKSLPGIRELQVDCLKLAKGLEAEPKV